MQKSKLEAVWNCFLVSRLWAFEFRKKNESWSQVIQCQSYIHLHTLILVLPDAGLDRGSGVRWEGLCSVGWLCGSFPWCWLWPHLSCWTPVNLDASKWPWDGMCDVKAANLFCCEVLYCSRFEALRILSIRRNNLPDVLISPVHWRLYIRRIFKAEDVYFWQLLSFNDFPAPATLQKTDKCILFPSFKLEMSPSAGPSPYIWPKSRCWLNTPNVGESCSPHVKPHRSHNLWVWHFAVVRSGFKGLVQIGNIWKACMCVHNREEK